MKKIFLLGAMVCALGMFAACGDKETSLPSTTNNTILYSVIVPEPYGGNVEGTGEYKEGDTATLLAVPWSMMYFDHWSDGDQSPIKKFVVTQDTSFNAYFEPMEI